MRVLSVWRVVVLTVLSCVWCGVVWLLYVAVGVWQVLVKDGVASRWLFTSRGGEVMKKRGLDSQLFHDTLLRQALANKSNTTGVVAIARAGSAPPRLLPEQEWTSFCKQFDSNVMSLTVLQAYVPPQGGTGTVYRNTFNVTNQAGKVVTSTVKHAYVAGLWMVSDGCSTARCVVCMCAVPACPALTPVWLCLCLMCAHASYTLFLNDDGSVGRHAEPVVSRENRLNDQLDAMTHSVVRYLESHSRCRITTLELEYVISDGTPFLMWAHDIQVLTGDAASDLRLSSLAALGSTRRGGGGTDSRPASPTRATRRPASPALDAAVLMDRTSKDAASQLMLKSASTSLHNQGGRKKERSLQDRRRRARRGSTGAGSAASDEFGLAKTPLAVGKKAVSKAYPTPFRCHGDYCECVSSCGCGSVAVASVAVAVAVAVVGVVWLLIVGWLLFEYRCMLTWWYATAACPAAQVSSAITRRHPRSHGRGHCPPVLHRARAAAAGQQTPAAGRGRSHQQGPVVHGHIQDHRTGTRGRQARTQRA